MTERGPFTGLRGAPDPAEPSNPRDPAAPASRPQTAAPPAELPADLGAVRRTDAVIESLAAWRAAGSATRSAPGPIPGSIPGPASGAADRPEAGRPRQADDPDPDPAVRLLRALITDVDDPGPDCGAGSEPAPPCPPRPPAPSGPGTGPRRRGPRTIVALGVAGAVLASTGVAAAGGGATDHSSAAPAAPSTTTSGAADDTGKTFHTDTDAGTHDRPRPPVRPAPKPERPTPTPSGDSGDQGDARPRPRYPFPFGPRPRRPETPAMTVHSAPAGGTDGASTDDRDTRRRIEDLRRRTQQRMNQRQNPYDRDD
ncbi:hypothetical protein [Actinomadura sp. 3N407]|uniref:hypothetical protein n=1 Tax=Actinomadura sp. 3N407 TaxID=3457423 RepID=UPI003FCE5A97